MGWSLLMGYSLGTGMAAMLANDAISMMVHLFVGVASCLLMLRAWSRHL